MNKIFEGGNAIEARPMTQDETRKTYDWVIKNIFPIFKISDKIDARPIGSFGKKKSDQTSGDIDIAIGIDQLAGVNGISVESVLNFVDDELKKKGYETSKVRGFNQVSFGVPINGDPKLGIGQIDFMFTDSLKWSDFMYHSPDFSKFESKYKGLYRNILLMKIISNADRKATKLTDTGETEEYQSYVVRLNQGVVKVTKSFKGKKGLLKNPKLLKDQDKFITNTPEEVASIAFGPNVLPSDIMTFEDTWNQFTSPTFIYKNKFDKMLKEFILQIKRTKVPIPSEVELEYPQLIESKKSSVLKYVKLFEEFNRFKK
tara:strand:- start:50639 stop:51583 length:945 start_codon:yes stop_codon:yes gene_type:complete